MSWALEKFGIRVFQFVFFNSAYLLNWRQPYLIEGDGSFSKLPKYVKDQGHKNVLVISGRHISKSGMLEPLFKGLDDLGIKYTFFANPSANPKTDDIQQGVDTYLANGCEAIIAVGGGSPIDAAKAMGAKIARPNKSFQQLGGTLKVMKKIPPLYVVPTTAGTGTEATIAAVVTDSQTHHKYSINDLVLIPKAAVMDATLTVGLPPFTTAATGIDALTHAVEAYITRNVPRYCHQYCEEAVVTIFKYVERAFKNGDDLEARREMLYASYKAGISFTRCGVTYVHPIAHTLGGLYGVPHGQANAVILPYCLEYYGECVHKKLARLADLTGVSSAGQTDAEKSAAFIAEIRRMNVDMGLDTKFEIKDEDIPQMVEWALAEAHPMYQVPVLLNGDQLKEIIEMIRAK